MTDLVIFRKFNNGEIIAIFPKIRWNSLDVRSRTREAYTHKSQYLEVDPEEVKSRTTRATKEEYESLAKELKKLGYKLEINSR